VVIERPSGGSFKREELMSHLHSSLDALHASIRGERWRDNVANHNKPRNDIL